MKSNNILTFVCAGILLLSAIVIPQTANAAGTITLSQTSNVTVTFVSTSARYDNSFGISSPINRTLGSAHSVASGTQFTVEQVSAGELVIFINNQTGTFYSGSSSRNGDGVDHARVTSTGTNSWTVGFEDKWGGFDFDYNDVVLTVTVAPSIQTCTSFTYSNWSDCLNGTQTRTVTSSSPTGCTGGSPVLSQSCTATPTDFSPKGTVFSCDGTAIYGWSCDPDAYSSPVAIHAYADGDLPANFAAGVHANQVSDANVRSQCGNTPNHNFVLPFPNSLKDGSSHLFKVWALNLPETGIGPNLNTLLSTLTCTPTSTVVQNTCTSFTYSNWSACNNGTQTRTVTSSSPTGCTGGNPILSQSCSSCTPNVTKKCVNGDSYWFDSCNTQGALFQNCTANQTCSAGNCINQNITCNTNADCGTNGYVGSQTCSNGNVYQDYRTYTCNNPGTASSTCTPNTVSQLKQTCGSGQTCSGGSCVSVSCSTNSDCGTNGYVNSPICQNGNVWQDYRTYTCNNAGTANSTCVPNTVSQLKTTCTGNQTCSGGSCSSYNTLSVSCYASPSTTNINQTVTFNCNVSGGTGSYTYNWNGACSGTSQNCITSFSYAGTQTANVTVYSGSQSQSQSVSVNVNSNQNNCTYHAYQRCSGNYLYWYDSCGTQQDSQYCSNGCYNNICQNNYNSCTYHAYQRCANNAIYWYDSCGTQQDLIQVCTNGCNGNVCQNYNNSSTVQTNSPTNIYNNQATLNGYLYTSGNTGTCYSTVWFQWGYTQSYGYETPHLQQNYSGTFTQNLANLLPGNIYYFRAAAQDCTGNIVYGQNMTLNTAPQVLGASIISTGLTNNIWVDSFILPLMLALLGIWAIKSGMFIGVEKWFFSKKKNRKEMIANKELNERILTIKRQENN